MDDDVKNLFQKFGQTTDAYREINRDADSEQARQRWPLLRDVRVNGAPTPKRAHLHEPEVAVPNPANQNAGMFNPASAKATAKIINTTQQTAVPAPSLLAATTHGTVTAPPLKQTLLRQQIESDAEVEEETESAPAFMSKIMPTAPREAAPAAHTASAASAILAKAETPASGLFAQRQNVAQEQPKAPAPKQSILNTPSHVSAAPVAQAVTQQPAARTTAVSSVLQSIGGHRNASAQEAASPSKNVPVSAVFGRLAAKPEEEKPAEAGINSFFKKIFKP